MGALHEGHLSLIRRARADCGCVVVSIFVNPLQFERADDLARYPRRLEDDLRLCEREQVDLVFAPTVEDLYPPGFCSEVHVKGLSEVVEGASRPGHFIGVTTVVLKLFNIVNPDAAYFGMKDYQQLIIVQRMVTDLNLGVEIMPMPTVRDADGLALSSRNLHLSPDERKRARAIPQALAEAHKLVRAGVRSAQEIREAALGRLERAGLEVDYVALLDPTSLQSKAEVDGAALLALAARVGNTRLIDNTMLSPRSEESDVEKYLQI